MGLMNQTTWEWDQYCCQKGEKKRHSHIVGVTVCWIKISTRFTVSWDCLPGVDRKHHCLWSMFFIYIYIYIWQSENDWCSDTRVILDGDECSFFLFLAKFKKREERHVGLIHLWTPFPCFHFFFFSFMRVRMQADARLWRKTFEQLSWNKVEPLLLLVQHRLSLLFKSVTQFRFWKSVIVKICKTEQWNCFFVFFLNTNSVLEEIFYYLIHNTFVLCVIKSLSRVFMPATTFKRAAI